MHIIQAMLRGMRKSFLDLNLGDKRLDMRFGMIMNYRMQKPSGSIPDSFSSSAKAKGTYRFISNEKADPEVILKSHTNSTIRRLKDKKIILASTRILLILRIPLIKIQKGLDISIILKLRWVIIIIRR
jgi:hypothetical protein